MALQAKLRDLSSQVSELEERVCDLEDLQADIQGITDSVATLQLRLFRLRQDFQQLDSSVASLFASVQGLWDYLTPEDPCSTLPVTGVAAPRPVDHHSLD